MNVVCFLGGGGSSPCLRIGHFSFLLLFSFVLLFTT